VSGPAAAEMVDGTVAHGVIKLDGNSAGLRKRAKQGLNATSVRDEMAKEFSKTQQQFRGYAYDDMLEAADRYCSGTTSC